MQFERLAIPDVILFTPRVFSDDRGFFFESFNLQVFEAATGQAAPTFVQDNHSHSVKGVLRGLHLQRAPHAQGKLVRVVQGAVFDVAVDLRVNSPTWGRWVGQELSADNKCQIWIPPGFAHGFLTLSDTASVLYKATHFYAPQAEVCIAWNDPDLGITWPDTDAGRPALSPKDQLGLNLSAAQLLN
jgi:dTDP-4-dehydrorhamnose 3,5-epimerase